MTGYKYLVVIRYSSGHEERIPCVSIIEAEVRMQEAKAMHRYDDEIELQAYRLVPLKMRGGVLVEDGA